VLVVVLGIGLHPDILNAKTLDEQAMLSVELHFWWILEMADDDRIPEPEFELLRTDENLNRQRSRLAVEPSFEELQ